MRKLFTFLLGLTFLSLGGFQSANAQEYWNKYYVDETFDELSSIPEGWTTKAANQSCWGKNLTPTFDGSVLNLSCINQSGARGAEMQFPSTGTATDVCVNFDWLVTEATITTKNAFAVYLLGSNSENPTATDGTAYVDAIAAIYLAGGSGVFHYWNSDIKGLAPVEDPDLTTPVIESGTINFARVIANGAIATDSLNAPTKTTVAYATGVWYQISAILDFETKIVKSLTITEKENPTNTQTIENKPFISNLVSDLSIVGIVNTRSTSGGQGNGNTIYMNTSLDNFQVYEKVLSLGKANVTINYLDQSGTTIKPPVVLNNQEIGLEYTLSTSDKARFEQDGFFYAYDATRTTTESVTVVEGGASIKIYFKKSPIVSGIYTWTGASSIYWDELDDNFAVSGGNISYQNGNGVAFTNAGVANKEILIDNRYNLGAGGLTISAEGYNLTGSGVLSGTGSLTVNTSTSIGIETTLAGGAILNAGTLEIKNARAATKYAVEAGTTLNINTGSNAFSAPITGNGGEFTFLSTAQVAHTATITGIDVINYPLLHQGNTNDNANIRATPRYNNTFAGQVKVTTELDTAFFGTTLNQPNTKINLGDNTYLVFSENPANTTEGTTMEIGELSGTTESGILGNRIRTLTYKVGALNTNSTFAGTINRFGLDQWDTQPLLHFTKTGTGIWNLSGNSPEYVGNISVENGTLQIDGTIGSEATVMDGLNITVADTAALAGNGQIYSQAADVFGKLSGGLTFGGSLSLKPSTETTIAISGASSDKITVIGDLFANGKLNIVVQSQPVEGTVYQVLDAPSIIPEGDFDNGFSEIIFPTGNWAFDLFAGTLTYTGGYSSLGDLNVSKEVVSREYYDITGKMISSDSFNGIVIEKVKYTDGSVSVSKKLNKK